MEFRLKNELEEIRLLAEAIELWGEENGIPGKTLFQLNLALDELLTNTITYGYPEGGEHEIMLRLIPEGEKELLIEIRDDGLAFNPLEVKAPDLKQDIEERPIGGLGIHLVRQMLDELEYRRENGQNILLMRKKY
ncbi:ATP-binding protein [Syntrophomonas wolfei]|jgi:anti-sigma regulatory factor (Ser/Thr protein kinase)|uniref:ATP-binding protein n=1 Tax=Syntrophomonas wolfei TaxID=863 RepID=A0A354YZ75_9FIRM|nr:ATP-binding protein [Syntrophomonas wolfei]HBK54643.1 ATP-binding protein [Syntrophomonas wolfei]